MLIKDLAEKISKEDLEDLRSLWMRKFFREEQERIIDIFEKYTGKVYSRTCPKCRSETIYKVQKLFKYIDDD